jgi:predicted CoA-binding protein
VPHRNPANDELRKLLASARTIAIVGASSNPDRPSNGIMRKLQGAGYHVIPVNPNEKTVLGERAYGSLRDVPEHIDIVDVFRRPEYTPAIADDAASVKAGALWLQSGIVNEDAAARGSEAGLTVVMDACIGVMHSLLRVGRK